MFDIHHLQVGSSVSSFVIMPDGTTMLIDAGDLIVENTLAKWAKLGPPFSSLHLKHPFPNDSKTPAEWIIDYMKEMWPSAVTKDMELDYLINTHFHADHFGDGSAKEGQRSKSASGKYVLSGIPELVSKVKVRQILDRGYPDYNVPREMRGTSVDMDNYLQFVDENKDTISFDSFRVGSSSQIRMQHNNDGETYDDFFIRVIKSGIHVAPPYDPLHPKHEMTESKRIEGDAGKKVHGNENTMSAAVVVEYGNFRYYEGADQEIVRNKTGHIIFDTIGPTAKAAGPVDVATLNHHAHGVTQDYFDYIDPPIMILQGWSSDQPPKSSMEMIAASPVSKSGYQRAIFATDVFEDFLDSLGPELSKFVQSRSGHVVVRVNPKNKDTGRQTFQVSVLDGNRRVKSSFDRILVRPKA